MRDDTQLTQDERYQIEALLKRGHHQSGIADAPSVTAVLGTYETEHRPVAERLLGVAQRSLEWYEQFREHMRLDPWAFVHSYMVRGERLARDDLRRHAPRFAENYERHHGNPP